MSLVLTMIVQNKFLSISLTITNTLSLMIVFVSENCLKSFQYDFWSSYDMLLIP